MTLAGPIVYGYNIDPVYWSLQVELVFYCMVFVVGGTRNFRCRLVYLGWAWLAVASLNMIATLPPARLTAAPWAAFFVVGIALFIDREKLSVKGTALLVVAVTVALLSTYFNELRRVDASIASSRAATMTMAILIALAAICVRLPMSKPFRSLSAFLGKLSYPVYLLHAVSATLIINALLPLGGVAFLIGGLLLVGASVAINVVEPSAARLIRRWSVRAGDVFCDRSARALRRR